MRKSKHGMARTPEYRAWVHMKYRCTNPNAQNYHRYGGRGIQVCEQWMSSFISFLADVGHRPIKNLTLERINNDGNYEPGNVKWATQYEQTQNRHQVTKQICLRGHDTE